METDKDEIWMSWQWEKTFSINCNAIYIFRSAFKISILCDIHNDAGQRILSPLYRGKCRGSEQLDQGFPTVHVAGDCAWREKWEPVQRQNGLERQGPRTDGAPPFSVQWAPGEHLSKHGSATLAGPASVSSAFWAQCFPGWCLNSQSEEDRQSVKINLLTIN